MVYKLSTRLLLAELMLQQKSFSTQLIHYYTLLNSNLKKQEKRKNIFFKIPSTITKNDIIELGEDNTTIKMLSLLCYRLLKNQEGISIGFKML